MMDESPFAAAKRVLSAQFGIHEPTNVQVMMLIDAIQEASPPHPDATIASLRAVLRDLRPDSGLDRWATRSSREIVKIMSKHPAVMQAAKLIDNEHLWCQLEGTIAGMLKRVTRGLDLAEKEPEKIEKPKGWCDGCNGVQCRCEQRA